MPKNQGNAHGEHFSEADQEIDEQRNHNRSKGRQHFPADTTQKAGGHSDRTASARNDTPGKMHEFRDDSNDDDQNRHNKSQDEGGMQGDSRNSGGHQGGRNQPNS
ncbi:MAG: hypothetical protein JWP00_3514 [Chloroflexi bacterium]|jgi:hypothetical protein|nr:hypothetical protein [Chloroflexota bacterium]